MSSHVAYAKKVQQQTQEEEKSHSISKACDSKLDLPVPSKILVINSKQEEEDEDDTLEEDIGDFSVGQERMRLQSQIMS